MKGIAILVTGIVLFFLLFKIGVALAAFVPQYFSPKNNLQSGGSGGFNASLENFHLAGSFGGLVQVHAQTESGSYQLCSGFLCGSSELFDTSMKLYLPNILKSPLAEQPPG